MAVRQPNLLMIALGTDPRHPIVRDAYPLVIAGHLAEGQSNDGRASIGVTLQ